MIKAVLPTILLLLLAPIVLAQEVVFSKPEKLSSKIQEFELIGKTDQGVLFMKWGEQLKEVEALDQNTLQTKWKKELIIEGKNFDVIDPVLNFRDEIVIIYTTRQNGVMFLYGQRYDTKMNPVGPPKLLDSTKKKFGSQNFEYELVHNTDRSIFVVIKKFNATNNYEKVAVNVYNRNLVVQSSNEIAFNDRQWYESTVVSQRGDIFVLTGQMRKAMWSADSQFESLVIHPVSPSGESLPPIVVGDDKYWINDFDHIVDPINNSLIIGGFFAVRDQRFTKGHFYCTVNLSNYTVGAIKYEAFSKEMIQSNPTALGWGKTLNPNVRSEYLDVTHILARSDGGAVIVGENSYSTERQGTGGAARYGTPMGRITDQLVIGYSYTDIFVVSTQNNGELDWSKILVKNQYSEEDGGFYSSFAMYNGRKDIRFIFNEEIKFNTNISNYALTPKGEMNVKGLFNSSTYQVKLAPRYAFQISRNEMIVPAYNQRMEFLLAKIAY